MNRVAIVARLKEGAELRAGELLTELPPFNLAESGLLRHCIYLSAGEVVFVFEGDQVEWIVDDQLAGQFLHPLLAGALEVWRPIVDGEPRIASERFSWERDAAGSRDSQPRRALANKPASSRNRHSPNGRLTKHDMSHERN